LVTEKFQSTPSGGKATDEGASAPLTHKVSIHAFRGEGDILCGFPAQCAGEFQSTPSGGKATDPDQRHARIGAVSIHAFRGEGDTCLSTRLATPAVFQSTPSGGKATPRCGGARIPRAVSIHAFRGEGDRSGARGTNQMTVSIHAFRGEGDPQADNHLQQPRPFQSTPSGGKATGLDTRCGFSCAVSIHAFRGEGDAPPGRSGLSSPGFNPRLPGGRRPRQQV